MKGLRERLGINEMKNGKLILEEIGDRDLVKAKMTDLRNNPVVLIYADSFSLDPDLVGGIFASTILSTKKGKVFLREDKILVDLEKIYDIVPLVAVKSFRKGRKVNLYFFRTFSGRRYENTNYDPLEAYLDAKDLLKESRLRLTGKETLEV